MSDSPPLDLEAIKKRYEAATAEPWEAVPVKTDRHERIKIIAPNEFANPGHTNPSKPATICSTQFALPVRAKSPAMVRAEHNFAFLSHARTDVPALVAEVERLRKDRDHWKANHDAQVKIKRDLHEKYDAQMRANRGWHEKYNELAAKLPKTVDGVIVVPGMEIFDPLGDLDGCDYVAIMGLGRTTGEANSQQIFGTVCSTREAALAASAATRGEGEGDE